MQVCPVKKNNYEMQFIELLVLHILAVSIVDFLKWMIGRIRK